MSDLNVLDASAVIALLQAEKGDDMVRAAIHERPCCWSTVNYCETIAKLCGKGMPNADARTAVDKINVQVVSFDRDMAGRAAFLRVPTKNIGASLGDRACLALAGFLLESGDIPVVYTAEKIWTKIPWKFKLVLIR